MNEIGLKKSELDTPILWVDLDRMESNIAHIAQRFKSAGVDWRPHTKGIKVPGIAHKMIDAGAIGVTCAKLGEAEVMAQAGIRDILVANQVVGLQKITRLVNLSRYANVKVAVDNPANIAQIGELARAKGVDVGVLVEVNTGMNRCGVEPGQATVELSRLAHETEGVRYRGIMAWEGHTVGIVDPEEKHQAIERAMALLGDSAQRCREADLPVEIVSGGGSGSYQITPTMSVVTEMQTGGAIFNDVTYEKWGVTTDQAIFVRSMVVSRPAPDRIIFDGGFKAMPAWNGREPRPVGLDHVVSVRASAEHGVVALDAPNSTVEIGQSFDFVPGYTDMTLFLHDNLYGIRDNVVEAVWSIAGRGKLR